MALDFIAIDFETANFTRASACAVGVTRVENGVMVAQDGWFIDPPGGLLFTNTFIHGITAADVASAPSWNETVDRLADFSRELPFVGYSGFDRGVYNAANKLTGAADRGFGWRSALSLAQRRFPDGLEDHRLPTVVEYLGLDSFAHHNALADAVACAAVVLGIARLDETDEMEVLWPIRVSLGGSPRPWYGGKGPLPTRNESADPRHPLYGQSICFSGTPSWVASKHDVQQIAADFGATIEQNVTKRTTILVVGDYTPGQLREGMTFSQKFERAQELRAKGQGIEIVDGDEFFALVNLDPADY